MARLKTTRPRSSRRSLTSSESELLSTCSSSCRVFQSHGLFNPRRTDSKFHPSVLIAGDPYEGGVERVKLTLHAIDRENHGEKENTKCQDEIEEGLEEDRKAHYCTEPKVTRKITLKAC